MATLFLKEPFAAAFGKKISLAGLMAVAQPANAWPQGLVACHVFRCFLGLFWALQTFSGCFRCFGPFMGISRRFWCFLVFPGCFGPFLGGVFLAVLMFSGLSWVFRNLWAAFSGRFWCFLAFSGGFGLFVGISGVFGVFWPFLGVSGCLWALLGVFGVFWPFLGVSGCLWAFLGVFLVFSGLSWVFRAVSGHFWAFFCFFLVFPGCFGLFLGISGRVWCFLVCPGCFKAFSGHFWACLVFSGLDWLDWPIQSSRSWRLGKRSAICSHGARKLDHRLGILFLDRSDGPGGFFHPLGFSFAQG